MTKQFQYTNIKKLQPRAGNNFATEYYQQTKDEYDLLKLHIEAVNSDLTGSKSTEVKQWFVAPIANFCRRNGPNYTPRDVVTDLLRQLESGKDVPSGMLGRWNRLFKDTPYDFELTKTKVDRSRNTFNELFSLPG